VNIRHHSDLLDQVSLFISRATQLLQLLTQSNDFGKVLHEHMLSYFSSENTFVAYMDSEFIKLDSVSEVEVDVSGDDHQHDKESCDKNYDVVLLSEQYLG